MYRPNAKNRGGEVGGGLKAIARKRWLVKRREAAQPVITSIKKAFSADATMCRRITNHFTAGVEADNRDVYDVLRDVLESEWAKVYELSEDERQDAEQALLSFSYLTRPASAA